MRCFLMRKGHIAAVEFLEAGPDESLIEQGRRIFRQRTDQPFDGFEIWDRTRQVHVHPEPIEDADRSLHRPPDASSEKPAQATGKGGLRS